MSINTSNESLLNQQSRKAVVGIHKEVMSVEILDFYPSIIKLHNICVTTDISDIDTRFEEGYDKYNTRDGCIRISKKKGELPEIYKNLDVVLEHLKNKNDLYGIRSQIKIQKHCLFGKLPEKLRNLVVYLANVEIQRIHRLIEENGGEVIYSSTDTFVYKSVKEIQITSDYRLELSESKFSTIVFSSSKIYSYYSDGTINRDLHFNLKSKADFPVVTEAFDFISRSAALSRKYTTNEFLRDLYEMANNMLEGRIDNSKFTKSITLGVYVYESYFMNLYRKYLHEVEGKDVKIGEKVDYQVIKSESGVKIGDKMRLPSDVNNLDYSYYISKMRALEEIFNISEWSSIKSSPVMILAKLVNSCTLTSFDEFYSMVKNK